MRGIILKLASVSLFVVMSAMIKAAAPRIPAGEAVFFRSAFALPVILLWLTWRRDLSTGLRTRDPLGHLWRGLVGVSAMGCTFAGLGLLPLPEVTAIGFAAPLVTVILGSLLLGERVRLVRLSAVGAGLLGVLIILWPRLSFPDEAGAAASLGAALVLASCLFRGLAQIQIRRLVGREETSAIVFYFSVTAALLSLGTVPFGWAWPQGAEWALLIGAGVIGGFGQILLTSAYRYGEAGLLAPFEYSAMLFALILGYVLFEEVPTPWMLAGAAIVIASGLVIIWRERRLGLRRGKARSGMTPQG